MGFGDHNLRTYHLTSTYEREKSELQISPTIRNGGRLVKEKTKISESRGIEVGKGLERREAESQQQRTSHGQTCRKAVKRSLRESG